MNKYWIAKSGCSYAVWDHEPPCFDDFADADALDKALKKFNDAPVAWHDRSVGDAEQVMEDLFVARIIPRGDIYYASPALAARGVCIGAKSKAKRKPNVRRDPEVGGLFAPEFVRKMEVPR